MASRILAGFTVVFWVAMMAALVRVEMFPQHISLDVVPTERALAKMLSNPEPGRLNIYYQGKDIGHFGLSIVPLPAPVVADEASPDKAADKFQLRADLQMTLSMFGKPARLRIVSKSDLDARYEVQRFTVDTRIGRETLNIVGDNLTKQMTVEMKIGGQKELRVLNYGEMKNADWASALGMPGLPNLGIWGSALQATAPSSPAGVEQNLPHLTTKTYFDQLDIAGGKIRAYLIESKLNDALWAKIWVDESGQILKVVTPVGFTMLAEVLGPEDQTQKDSGLLHFWKSNS